MVIIYNHPRTGNTTQYIVDYNNPIIQYIVVPASYKLVYKPH